MGRTAGSLCCVTVPRIAVSGSVAYDTIMVFPGRFGDHILPDRTHVLNVSFQVDHMERRRGGTAANICYTLALLGEQPLLCGAVGAADFTEYDAMLREAGVDTSTALRCEDVGTAAGYITTDLDDNQITAFYAGAMTRAGAIDLSGLRDVSDVVVAADAADAMARHIDDSRALGARLTFAPAQQIPSMPDSVLRRGIETAWLLVGNDYEIEMIRQRLGMPLDELRGEGAVAVTKGAAGSDLHTADGLLQVAAAPVATVVDPTGAGDAYIGGLLAGARAGLSLEDSARLGSVAASFAVEQNGPQSHRLVQSEVAERYRTAYGVELALPALPAGSAPA